MTRLAPGFAAAAAALLLAGATGCASLFDRADLRGHSARFEKTRMDYVHFIRWGEYGAAAYLVDEERREEFLDVMDRYEDVRFSDYEVLRVDVNELKTEADVIVTFYAYHLNRLVEHKWTAKQHWKRELASKNWYVEPDVEKFEEALDELR